MPAPKPVVLCILDGWGIGPNPATSAPAQARVPTFNHLWATCPHATLTTFGPDVGLPTGQMGNSEVGHTNIGAGRTPSRPARLRGLRRRNPPRGFGSQARTAASANSPVATTAARVYTPDQTIRRCRP